MTRTPSATSYYPGNNIVEHDSQYVLADTIGELQQRIGGFHTPMVAREIARLILERDTAQRRRLSQYRRTVLGLLVCLGLALGGCVRMAFAGEPGWRVGVGARGGLIEGGPATAVHLDLNPGPLSHLHLQPRAQVWKPDGREGVVELGLDALYHLRPCHFSSFYVGAGVGAEWRGGEEGAEPCACEGPPASPPPAKDPPIAVALAGWRFLPSGTVDLGLEGRVTFTTDRPRAGVFLAATWHEPRAVRR